MGSIRINSAKLLAELEAQVEALIPDLDEDARDGLTAGLLLALSQALTNVLRGGRGASGTLPVPEVEGGGGGPAPSDNNPAALGTAAPGVSALYSRDGHVHPMPDAADVGADPEGSAAAAQLAAEDYAKDYADALAVTTLASAAAYTEAYADPAGTASSEVSAHLSGAPHVALSSATPQPLGSASAGSGTASSRHDHVHTMPSASDVGADPAGSAAAALADAEDYTDTELAAHVAASDPHEGYQKESEKGANNGYCGLDAGGLVDPSDLPAATTTAIGAVELATPNEYASGKIIQASDWRIRYSQNRRMYGARVMSLTTTPARDGVLSGSDFTGTQAWAQETTQGVGPYFDMVLTTASSRGWGSGTTLRFASLLSRCRFRQLVAWTSQSTTRTGAGFGPTVTAISDVATATAVGVRFVNDGGTLKGAAANGTSAEQTAAFAALSDGTFYWLEYDCDGTTANFYVYDVAGTLIEGPKTLNTYVPGSSSTNCAFGMYSRAYSGTPSHYDGGSFTAWGT